MVQKNQEVTVFIEDIGSRGEGIGKVDGYTLFIKDAIIGDTVQAKVIKAKKNYGYGRLLKVLTPSSFRVEAKCRIARQCGGCQIQELSYERQLAWKEKKVFDNIERIGGLTEYEHCPILGMETPWHYRNKAQYPVREDKYGTIQMGFYVGHTHQVMETDRCYIGVPENEEVLSIVKVHMQKYRIPAYHEETHTGLVRHVLIRKGFQSGQIMVCLVLNGTDFPESDSLVEELLKIPGMTSISLNVNTKKTNVILGETIFNLYGQGYIEDSIGNVKFQISPLSFFQVNPVQTEKLYRKVLEFAELSGIEEVWDLYCGIGTISLFLASRALQVHGVEIVSEAIEDARNNARLNGISNADFFVGKSEEVLPEYYARTGKSADVIVLDPPRKGCEESLLQTIVQMAPPKVIYVSCDSATLARDLKYLCQYGYQVRKVQPVDMFPQSGHVESIVLLSQKSPDSHINVKVEFGEGEGKVPLDNID